MLENIRKFIRHWTSLATYDLLFACNWLNPIATIYVNFRSFPLKQALKLPLFVYGRPNLYYLTGRMRIDGIIKSGMIKFNYTCIGAPSNMSLQSDLLNQGTIVFHGPGIIGTGNKIRVFYNAVLEFGEEFKIADMVNVGCYSKITVGNRSWIAHRCQILDANYHYIADFNKRIVPKWGKNIVIGDDCWICNTSTVSLGAVIPNNTIVTGYSLVNKDFSTVPENSIIGGIPAKFIANGFRRVLNPIAENKIIKFYDEYPDGLYEILEGENPDFYSIPGMEF